MDGGHLPVVLAGDKTALSNQELFELALEKHYEENFPQRAESEKFNLLGEKIAKYDELIEKSQNAIKDLEVATAEAEAATIKNDEAINNAVSELTELIMGILGQLSTNVLVEGTE
jgi:demethoxyubiquinone hydroxylase (CLK1/Coq7/Cat5 family)